MNDKLTAAIHQPHYFPWLPYMNKMASVDVFVLFDTVQLPRGKSRVIRAKYLNQSGEKWLSIPVGKMKGDLLQIKDVRLNDLLWKMEHFDKLRNAYRGSKFFSWACDIVHSALHSSESLWLVDIEESIIEYLCKVFSVGTTIVRASEILDQGGASTQEYVVALLERINASTYLSGRGKGSLRTIDEAIFKRSNIEICYQDFPVPPYNQACGENFLSDVSILDTLFRCGEHAREHFCRQVGG